MSTVMMQLGGYQFGLSTAAYQEFARGSEWTWAAQPRFGQDDALQFTGRGEDTINLPGVIYPEFRGGLGQIDAMRAEADQGVPLSLVDGLGRMLGDWVILQVEERNTVFISDGIPLKMEFSIRLRRAPMETGLGLIESVLGELTQGFPGTDVIGSARAVASSASNGAGGLVATLNSSLATISGFAGALGTQSSVILGTVRSGINAAKTLQNAGGDAASLLSGIKSPAGIASAMNGLVNVCGGVSRSVGTVSSTLNAAGLGIADKDAAAAVRASMVNMNQVNVLAVAVRTKAAELLGGI